MKKLILFLSLLFISHSISFPQNIPQNKSTEQTDYWNMAFTGGVLYNFVDNVDKDNTSRIGYLGGFEMFYNMHQKNSAVVISAGYGRNKRKNIIGISDYRIPYTEYYVITFGPRFYLGKNYFVETNFSDYIINYISVRPEPGWFEQTSSVLKSGGFMCFGIGVCAGMLFPLSQDLEAIIKGNINYMVPGNNVIVLGGLTTGIVFTNRKVELETEKRYKKKGSWSVTASVGINNPELFHNTDYKIGGNIGTEIAYRSGQKFEIYGNLDFNSVNSGNSTIYSSKTIDLICGPRFMIGTEKYKSFFELGMGLYLQDNQYDYYSVDSGPYLGLNFGTGLIINLNKHFEIPLRGKMHVVFNGEHTLGSYVTATGGLRYTL